MNLSKARKLVSADKWLLVDEFWMNAGAWNAVPLWQRRGFLTRVVKLVKGWGIEAMKKS